MDELEPELTDIDERLRRERPLPAPAFRGDLRRHLLAGSGRQPSRARIRGLAAAYALSGALLLAIAAVGVAGSGPLAAG